MATPGRSWTSGHWGKERVLQRRSLTVGVHLGEGRKGRTGPDATTVLHVGAPGFSFAEGKIWALHTAWSGNHTHYAERVFTGLQVIGGAESLSSRRRAAAIVATGDRLPKESRHQQVINMGIPQ
jgi:alpha-galactosidase